VGVRDILSAPWVFDTYQSLIGAPRCHRRYIDDYVRPQPGDRLIDFGCGLGVALKYLPADIDYLGMDIHDPYIQAAKKRYPSRKFVTADLETMDFAPYGKFDVGISFGVVHHLTDTVADALGRQAKATIEPGKRLVCIDPVYMPDMPKVAKFLIDHDRGSFPRNEEAYRKIFEPYGAVETDVVTDMLRVPYTMVITSVTF
jgi:SAM-dependent methyltransferase